MWFDLGLAGLFITSTLLHLEEDINLLVVSITLVGKLRHEATSSLIKKNPVLPLRQSKLLINKHLDYFCLIFELLLSDLSSYF
jgi:hypothetical protein